MKYYNLGDNIWINHPYNLKIFINFISILPVSKINQTIFVIFYFLIQQINKQLIVH